MKRYYKFQRPLKQVFILLVLMLFATPWLQAQVKVPFTQRTSQYTPSQKIYNIKGDFQMIGNTNLTLQGGAAPDANNYGNMIYVDVDGVSETLNSSSADLTFSTENGANPNCSEVVFAGLYWTGRAHNEGNSPQTFIVNETSKNFYNNNTINSAYTLSITSVNGPGNHSREHTATYTFTPTNGGDAVVFKFHTYRISPGNWYGETTVTVGGGTPVILSGSLGNHSGHLSMDFDTPYVINTGTSSIRVNYLYKSKNDNTIDNSFIANASYDGKALNKRKVKLRHNDGAYEEITATANDIWYPSAEDGNMYAAYAEVTDFVRTKGLGTYTVADIALREGDGGGTGYYGGWGMIVVYQNSKMKWRDVTIFDGYAYVIGGTASHELPVSGFKAVQNGDVNMKLGLIAGEGDAGIEGDYFHIRNAADNDWVALSHSVNNATNFFNSSVNTGGNPRNPNYVNNTGLDIAMFNIDNSGNQIIANNQTSTKFKYGSTQDTYIISCIAMSIDAYIPEAEALNTITQTGGSGSDPEPGDIIEYKLTIKNQGTEAINNYKMDIPIPYSASFVSCSATYHSILSPLPAQPAYNAPTNSIVWNIGTLPNPLTTPGINEQTVLATLTYKLKVTEDCFILSNPNCSPAVVVTGESSGVGATSGTDFSHIPMIYGYTENGECQGEPITMPPITTIDAVGFLQTHCNEAGIDYTTRHFKICDIEGVVPFNDISPDFPDGSRFWSAISHDDDDFVIPADGATEYTVDTHFPADMGNVTYYAIPPGKTKCYWEFTITVSDCVIAKDDVTQTPQGVAVKGNVLTNDDGVTIAVTKATYNDSRAEVNIPLGSSQPIPGGDILFNSNGTYTFTSNGTFTGKVPTITYTIKDAVLEDEASATLDIKVVPKIKENQNDTPIANNDIFVTEQSKQVTFNALVNDHDSDKDGIKLIKIKLVTTTGGTVQTIDIPAAGTNQSVYNGTTLTGTIAVQPNGALVFTPASSFTGEVPAIEYVIEDDNAAHAKDSALIKITVMPHRINKVYLNDDYGVARNANPDEAIKIKPLDNDFNPEGPDKTLQIIELFNASGFHEKDLTSPWSSDEDIYNEGVKIGTLSFDFAAKELKFQGESDFKGTIAMPYTIKDNAGAEDKGTIYFTQLETGTNPLPIELVSFDATLQGNGVELTWVSATEINNDFYSIYKSNDAKIWEFWKNVKGAGNSSVELSYTETDNQPYHGATYYKLSQTDFDGTSEELGIRVVQLNGDNGNFTVYPNPTEGLITIDGAYNNLNSLRIVSASGTVVTNNVRVVSVSARRLKLDFSNLSSGTYFIHLDNSLIQVVKN